MEYGLGKGLAVDLGFDQRIADLHRNSELDRRAANDAMAKAKMFADDVEFQNAMNSHDSGIVKEHAKGIIKKMGEYRRNNPDLLYNPDKLVEFNMLKRELKDNPDLTRGLASDSAYKEYLKDLQEVAKNPQQHDTAAYDEVKNQWANYLKYGNQNGIEAAQTQGKQAFLYTKPLDFIDKDELYRKSGSAFQAKDIQYLKNGRDGAYQTVPKEADLRKEAESIYSSRPRQFDQQYKKRGIDPITGIMDGIRPYIKTEFDIGDKNKLGEEMLLAKYKHDLEKADATPGASPYKITALGPGYAKPPADLLAGTFGSELPHYITNGKEKFDNTGDIFHYTGDIYDKGFRSDGKYKKTGIKVVDGYVLKPLDTSNEAVSKIVYDPWGFSGNGGTDYEVRPEWKDKATIIDSPVDKDGKSHKLLKIKVNAEVNANDPSYQGRYDKQIVTAKQQQGIGVSESQLSTQPKTIRQNGYTYTLNESTGQYE